MRVAGVNHPSPRYFVGDIRDLQRLERAFQGGDIVAPIEEAMVLGKSE
jgi:UDP-N-acetylglucosamine 4,6-dehydratase